MNPNVDAYLRKVGKWREELAYLRRILLDCQLTEELKWGAPCYTFQQTNLAILGGFKKHCVLTFFKGAWLKDPHGLLSKPGENTQVARLVPFTSVREIVALESRLKALIHEAIAVEIAGLKVDLKTPAKFIIPEELQKQLDASPTLKAAFAALTPGRQRAYVLYISAARQVKTRESRTAKCRPQILRGKGLNDP